MSAATPTPLRSPTQTAPLPSLRDRLPPQLDTARGRWSRLWPWAPLLFAAAYFAVVLANFSSLITAINMDGDAVVGPVIGTLLGVAPPRQPCGFGEPLLV